MTRRGLLRVRVSRRLELSASACLPFFAPRGCAGLAFVTVTGVSGIELSPVSEAACLLGEGVCARAMDARAWMRSAARAAAARRLGCLRALLRWNGEALVEFVSAVEMRDARVVWTGDGWRFKSKRTVYVQVCESECVCL